MALSRYWRDDPLGSNLIERDPFADFFSTGGKPLIDIIHGVTRRGIRGRVLHFRRKLEGYTYTHWPRFIDAFPLMFNVMYVKTTHLYPSTGGWLTPSVGGALNTGTSRGQPVVPSLNLDVKEKNNEFQVAVDAPGMKKEGAFAVSGPTEGFDDD
jgi:hypothetical protein